MTTIAKVITSSSVLNKIPIYSLQLRFPRIVLAELNTHRMLAKSTSSSRAIPVEKIISRIQGETARPIWSKNQSGMQGEILNDADPTVEEANRMWDEARDAAIKHARALMDMGIHKQDANRLLEPFVHVDTIISGTEWDNFFALRCHAAAAPLMQELACAIRKAISDSTPQRMFLWTQGGIKNHWHMPYVTDEDYGQGYDLLLPWISAARCARVSYLNHDGSRPDLKTDLALAHRLFTHGHMTPFEHVACAVVQPDEQRNSMSCIRGPWLTLRYLFESQNTQGIQMVEQLKTATEPS